jgi:predicted nucleotidyltransferase
MPLKDLYLLREQDELSLIRDYVLQNIPGALDVRLFGSRAKGTHRPDSDWDITIVSEEDFSDDLLHANIWAEKQIRKALSIPVDVHFVKPGEDPFSI